MIVTQGKVADLIGASQIALNCGSNDGVEEGDTAKVQRRIEVKDPDTQEPIGAVMITVVTLEIFLVQPKMCVGRVTDRVESPPGFDFLFSQRSSAARVPSLKRVTLNPDAADGQTVLVEIGQTVTVERPEVKETEEPF